MNTAGYKILAWPDMTIDAIVAQISRVQPVTFLLDLMPTSQVETDLTMILGSRTCD